jgi:hypothetical protein
VGHWEVEEAQKMTTLTNADIAQIAELTSPHMKALNDAVSAAFPDHPDEMYTVALAFNLVVLLKAFSNPDERARVVALINEFLAKADYRLVSLS